MTATGGDFRTEAVRTGRSDGRHRRTEPIQPGHSLGEVVGDIADSLGNIVRLEFELATTELKGEAQRAGRAAGMFGGAGVAAWLALVMVSFALAWWLDEVMHTAVAFLLVGLVWAAGAALLAARGRAQMQGNEHLVQTRASLKEDATWARTRKS